MSTVRRWYDELKQGRVSLRDEIREGRPSTAVTKEKVATIRHLIEENQRITYEEIRRQLGIGMSQIEKILHEHLRVRKICCRWIPRELTTEQKRTRVVWCQDMILKFNHGCSNAVYNIVIDDESWVYCYEPERKQQSCEWVFERENIPTKFRQKKSVGKQMIACFFSKSGHLATVPLGEQKTVNSEWYTTICLPSVMEKIRVRRSKSHTILHHDNAAPHTAKKTNTFLCTKSVALMTHPPYSPDLAPCDFFLFPKIKGLMRGLNFTDANEAVVVLNKYENDVPSNEWASCFQKWFERMKKCLKLKGEYFEKQ